MAVIPLPAVVEPGIARSAAMVNSRVDDVDDGLRAVAMAVGSGEAVGPMTFSSPSPPGSDFEQMVVIQDRPSGLRAAIVVHSTARGPAFGGIRRRAYPCDEAAVRDAMALAEAMTQKCALAGLSAGGAKTVMVDSGRELGPMYQALGRAIDQLGGRYVCGPDIGTGLAQLEEVRSQTPWVNPPGNDAGAATAQGVLAGLRAVWTRLSQAARRRVAIQGLGAVGLDLARRLVAEGVDVVGADPKPHACAQARALGVTIVEPEHLIGTPCDVLMPCAMGGTLSVASVAELRCSAVCGSANNQLVDDDAAEALRARSILHAPDIVVSSGAVIEGVLVCQHGDSADARKRVRDAIETIENTLLGIFEEAQQSGVPPQKMAQLWASRRLGGIGPDAERCGPASLRD